jgi:hypothetical protein
MYTLHTDALPNALCIFLIHGDHGLWKTIHCIALLYYYRHRDASM